MPVETRTAPASAESHPPRRLWNLLTSGSRVRYLLWRFLARSDVFTVRLKSGERLTLRSAGDRRVGWEVFVRELYRVPAGHRVENVRRIVDLGGNNGFSTLYLAGKYPAARVVAFEPHPRHCEQFAWHVEANGLQGRVRLVPAAAGVREDRMSLSDAGAGSSLVIPRGGKRFEVRVADWLAEIGTEPIDLLKVDIEGSEYELLADPRFAALEVRLIVLECHEVPEQNLTFETCVRRLQSLGYKTDVIPDGGCTMVWASK